MNRRSLLQFVTLCGLIFVAYALWAPRDDRDVRVSADAIRDIVEWQAELVGYPLSDEEARAAVDAFVEDEVLVREAFRQGVDRGDPRVRQFLAGATRRSLQPETGEEVTDPTAEELRAYFEASTDRYLRPETIVLDAVFFPTGTLEAARGDSVLVWLTSGEDPTPLRDRGAQFATLRGVNRSQLWRTYGRETAEEVFGLEPGVWVGPLESLQGTDFLRIVSREPAHMPSFEEAESAVRQDWELQRYDAAVQAELPGLRRKYRVIVEGEDVP